MGLFDALFRKTPPVIAEPDRLRSELFAAANAGDARRLEALARANGPAILEHFDAWRKMPAGLDADPRAMQAYAHGLITLAQVFAANLGVPSLLGMLTAPPEGNPMEEWELALQEARAHIEALRFAEARALLGGILAEAREMSGPGVDAMLPIAHGLLAECHFHAGAPELALPHLEEALASCEKSGDAAGVEAYVGSMFEVYRYLGRPEDAAAAASRMSTLLDAHDPGAAARWRTRATIVREGEPLNRVVAVVNGVTLELGEVQPARDMRVKFVFERNRIALRPATAHVKRGEKLAGEGRFDEALAAFREAAVVDPFDPQGPLQEALTLLHLTRYAEAVTAYRRVEELAPGWFHSRADLATAEGLAAGALDHVDFIALLALEDGTEPPPEKVKLAQSLLMRRRRLAVAHLHLGRNLARVGRDTDAEAALRAGLAADPDVDVATRMLVELAATTGDAGERAALLREAATLNGNLVAAASAALALRLK